MEMEGAEFLKYLSSQPESYLILIALLYAIKKFFPLFKSHLEIQGAQLASMQRTEKNTEANLGVSLRIEAKLDTLATKDNVLDVMLHGAPKITDSNTKQENMSATIHT